MSTFIANTVTTNPQQHSTKSTGKDIGKLRRDEEHLLCRNQLFDRHHFADQCRARWRIECQNESTAGRRSDQQPKRDIGIRSVAAPPNNSSNSWGTSIAKGQQGNAMGAIEPDREPAQGHHIGARSQVG